ncbi:MAG TPA: methyltransferase [Verrucomicrobiae bacterium]|nr:methyltransferase [Verrucomicrobiae bacterium]
MKNTTPERILQFVWGYAPTLIIQTAVHHGVFDLLAQSPQTLPQLAKRSGASERGLAAVLNALVGLQLLGRQGNRYRLTPESAAFLVSGRPAFLGGMFRHMAGQIIPQWLQLDQVVRTGRPAMAVNGRKDGGKFFAKFVESLFPLSHRAASALGEHLEIAKTKMPLSVLDIAAGSGVWGIALAQQSPLVRIAAADWPEVLTVTKKVARRCGLGRRLTPIPGDLLKSDFGSGHQVATLGHILHSEGADRSRKLLKKVFRALAPGGTVAISEFLVNDDRTEPAVSLLFAVNMLVNTEAGDTFSVRQISQWLRAAGFVKPRLLDVGAVSPLILATRP